MPYTIELMCIGDDFYPLLKAAADRLNGLQEEFEFRLTAQNQRPEGLEFRREQYVTTAIWEFLASHRSKHGGNRPHILAIVNAPLKSEEMGNLFGSHQAEIGFAVATLHGREQYVRQEFRYCWYYMVRYALSFVNPSIKSHDDPKRKSCYFHRKVYKREIRDSMDSGSLCDVCADQLEKSSIGEQGRRVSANELEALKRMRQFVANDYPHAIVMKGGGVKGLAFAAALIELEKYFWFDQHVGTSAGAITATLLAAGYSPADMVTILKEKNFRSFMDAGRLKSLFNLLFRGGLFPGEHFRLWIADLIGNKTQKMAETRMSDLSGALLYAARWGSGTVVFDSNGERRDSVAAFAARCSMSIPLFFFPQIVDGRRAFDGGLRNNFPLKKFVDDHAGKPFVALYLGARDDRNRRWFLSELLDIWIDGEEREIVDKHRDRTVVIDTRPVGTVDFNLDETEKQFLLDVGKAAALRFIRDRGFDDGPDEQTVRSVEEAVEASRIRIRRKRKLRFLIRLILIAAIGFGAWLLAPHLWQGIKALWRIVFH